jgi:hypothetical protein
MPPAPGPSPACSSGGLCAAATTNAGTSARTVTTAPARARAIWYARPSPVRGLDLEKEALEGTKLFDGACQDEARRKVVKHLDHERFVFCAAPFLAHCRGPAATLLRHRVSTPCAKGHLLDENLCKSSSLESLRATVHERCRFSRGPTTRSSSMPSGQRRARMRSVPTGPCAEDHATLTFRSAATPSGVADVRASRAVLAEDELKNMLLNPER